MRQINREWTREDAYKVGYEDGLDSRQTCHWVKAPGGIYESECGHITTRSPHGAHYCHKCGGNLREEARDER